MDFLKPHFWRAIITFPLWKIWVLFLFGASYLLLSIYVTYILNSVTFLLKSTFEGRIPRYPKTKVQNVSFLNIS